MEFLNEKNSSRNGFIIIEDGEKLEISWPIGPFDHTVSYAISRENMKKAFKSPRDAYEVMIFAETGRWPIEKDENEIARAFLRRNPELLIMIPKNQQYFDKTELEVLLKLAREEMNSGAEGQ